MKRKFYLFTFLSLFGISAFAQQSFVDNNPRQGSAQFNLQEDNHSSQGLFASSPQDGALFVGIEAGMTVPSLKAADGVNDWNKDYESRQAGYVAIFAEYRLSKYFYIQPELAYVPEGGQRNTIQPMTIPDQYLSMFQKAFNTDRDYLYANLKSVAKMNYIQLPILVKFSYPIAFKGKLQAFIEAGPNVGYLLVSEQTVKSKNLRVYLNADGTKEIPSSSVHQFFGDSIDTVIDASDGIHRWNVGVTGGVGVTWVGKRHKIFVEGGGNYGFVHLQSGDAHGKNNIGAATVLLGYMHNIHW